MKQTQIDRIIIISRLTRNHRRVYFDEEIGDGLLYVRCPVDDKCPPWCVITTHTGRELTKKQLATSDISTSQLYMFKEPINIVMPELSGVQVKVSDPN